MSSYSFQSAIPVTNDYDVVVIGGGTAGSIAAIQAGRMGARVALVEKNGILGGTAVVASVNFPGLFHAWTKQVIAGIGWEVIEETVRRGGADLPDFSVQYAGKKHPKHQIKVNRFVYSAVLDDYCLKAGVHIRFHEMPVHIAYDRDSLCVLLACKTGLSAVRANKIIDATGDANVAGMMGFAREMGETLQPGTLIYRLGGYRIEGIDRNRLLEVYEQALADGRIIPTDHRPGPFPYWSELLSGGGNCMHVTSVDGSTSVGRTEAELKARQSLLRTYMLLRSVPGCENLEISYFANECGIRETWRIIGEQTVTCSTYTSGYVWPDAVCYSFYPIDVHSDKDSTIDIRPLQPGIVPTIPYGALIPRGSDHVLVAGRSISGDREASSAYRVQASCMATGQAAGVAAVIAAQHNLSVRDVSLTEIKAALRQYKAIVP
jgi:hypothetical protein